MFVHLCLCLLPDAGQVELCGCFYLPATAGNKPDHGVEPEHGPRLLVLISSLVVWVESFKIKDIYMSFVEVSAQVRLPSGIFSLFISDEQLKVFVFWALHIRAQTLHSDQLLFSNKFSPWLMFPAFLTAALCTNRSCNHVSADVCYNSAEYIQDKCSAVNSYFA